MNESTFEKKPSKEVNAELNDIEDYLDETEECDEESSESNNSILNIERKIKKSAKLNLSFDYVKLNLASSEQIKKWAQRRLPTGSFVGEVSKPDTLNYRDLEPEDSGLFCQKIFGPIKDWKCSCGKYSGVLSKQICESCSVELTESRVRRYRMGYINLSYSCAHYWYIKGTPNYMTLILKSIDIEIKKGHIEEILYFHNEHKNVHFMHPLYKYSQLPQESFSKKDTFAQYFDKRRTKYREGTEILIEALKSIDLGSEISYLRALNRLMGKKTKIANIRRIRIFENFFASNVELSSMIFTALPVLPPNLRPLVEIDDSKLVSADANELYRSILIRNIRLIQFKETENMPDIITYSTKKLLQEGVDCLIDNARLPQSKIYTLNDRPLKSLTEVLEGKEGRFRQTLLGKRVDYSARSVIVVGPNLRLNQCGLPYDIAVKLFEGHLINSFFKTKIKAPNNNAKLANLIIKRRRIFVWKLLEKLTEKNGILLNRAPTLHKFGIQAFNPLLILGQAIQLHPLVCTGFNADFDGDQMAVHLPLYESSQLESQALMRPSNNILSPANGEVILKPTQDMVIGSYYLSLMIKNMNKNIKKYFSSEDEALNAFHCKNLNLHDNIFVRYNLENQLKVQNNQLQLYQSLESLSHGKIFYFKIFFSKKNKDKLYLLTNLGIITAYLIKKDLYVLKDLYLQTTVGRLVFANNIKKVFQKLDL